MGLFTCFPLGRYLTTLLNVSHNGNQINILNECLRKAIGAISSTLLVSWHNLFEKDSFFDIYMYRIYVCAYIFNEGKFKVKLL